MIVDLTLAKNIPTAGIKFYIGFENGNGLSVINGEYAYCDEKTFEIAPMINDELFNVQSWGDQVKGYVTSEEIEQIAKFAETHSSEEYRQFMEDFNFKNPFKASMGDQLKSLLGTMSNSEFISELDKQLDDALDKVTF